MCANDDGWIDGWIAHDPSGTPLSSSFALFPVEIGIGKMRPTVHNLVNSITSSQKYGGRKWNLPQRS
jgi:hypothetical protein